MPAKTPPADAELDTSLIPPIGFDVQTIASLGAEAERVRIDWLDLPDDLAGAGLPQNIPVAIVQGDKPEVRGLDTLFSPWRLHPQHRRGQAVAQTLESFHALANRHKTAHSAVFADCTWQKPTLTAVIDYHDVDPAGPAAYGKHRIHYPFPLSEEWKAWIGMNGQPMKQGDFAFFLEDRIQELSAPTEAEIVLYEREFATRVATPAQVVELSRGLQVRVESKVKNAVTLQTGEGEISFEEVHTDAAGQKLKVPGIFLLSLAPFFQGEKIRMPVRLRYRAGPQGIVWSYQLYRPDLAITEHVRQVLTETRAATGLPTYEGTPEMTA